MNLGVVFDGASSENSPNCPEREIGHGTYGLALHPNFMEVHSAFIYFAYSCNNGTVQSPQTKFKIARLKWDHSLDSLIEAEDLITDLPNGYDH